MSSRSGATEITRRIDELDAAQFLAQFWQKKPLLIRNAFPGFDSPLDPDELAGLACEEGVESRIVDVNNDYKVHHGPFRADFFAGLGDKGWTLLVQDVEKHLPDLAELLDSFSFIPSWRIDDLMVSWAAEGGGVGPHTDLYDVFLLQARGRRRWSIAEHFDPALVTGIDLKVLEKFTPEQEWVLEPGDMLYLPPNIAHDGIAVDGDCMTWSIGFRAPAAQGMISDLVELVQQRLPDDLMYTDPDLSADEARDGRISPAAFKRARAMVRALIEQDDDFLDEWFGRFVTEPKPWLKAEGNQAIKASELRERLDAGECLFRNTQCNLAWRGGPQLQLFVDGEAWNVKRGLEPLLALLCTERRLPAAALTGYLDMESEDEAGSELLLRLYEHGALYFIDDEQ